MSLSKILFFNGRFTQKAENKNVSAKMCFVYFVRKLEIENKQCADILFKKCNFKIVNIHFNNTLNQYFSEMKI